PGGRHRAARVGRRRRVPDRVRLSAVARWADALRGLARALQRRAGHAVAGEEPARQSRSMGAGAVARETGRRREIVQRIRERAMTDAVIVSTARTGLAKSWRGALNMTHGATLGAHVV